MKTSRTSEAAAGSVLLFLFVTGLGCTASRPLRTAVSTPADSTAELLIVDPWSLGPDVFARLASVGSESSDLNQPVEQTAVPAVSSELADEPVVPVVAEDANPAGKQSDASALQSPELNSELTEAAPQPANSIIYTVQLGTFLDRAKAQEFYDRASSVLGMAGTVQGDWPFYRLRFGNFAVRESADSLHRVAMSRGFYDARILKLSSAP